MRTITLLTDFGQRDYYVAAVKGTLLRLAPGCLPVDLSHEIPAGDVAAASRFLAAACPAFPPGTLHLTVVDPGVGGPRRILVVGRGDGLWVAPDNGLLTPFFKGASVRAVQREDLYLAGPGATFHGRDRFAPVAAFLAGGGLPEALGDTIDDPVRLESPQPRRRGGKIYGRIVHIDHYGNLITDIPASWLAEHRWSAFLGDQRTDQQVTHYAELNRGRAGLLIGSLGTVELSLNRASLAEAWAVERGDEIRLERSNQDG